MELSVIAAATIGFLGSTHCVGTCGGIVGALNAGARPRPAWQAAVHHLSYNGGRIVSYTAAGALAGLVGAQARHLPLTTVLPVGGVIAAVFMIALGLYLGGWWRAFAGLETAGGYLWRWIHPLGRKLLPARSPLQAFGLGLVWGWLPCGLVYAALALALVSGDAGDGAALMLGFGLGTLPMLLLMGGAAGQIGKVMRHRHARQFAGAFIIAPGIHTGITVGNGSHAHHGAAGNGALSADLRSGLGVAQSLAFGEACLTPLLGVE